MKNGQEGLHDKGYHSNRELSHILKGLEMHRRQEEFL